MKSWGIGGVLALSLVVGGPAWGQVGGHAGHGMSGGEAPGVMLVQAQPGMPRMGGPMGLGMMMRGAMGRGMMMGPMAPPDELPAERPLITFILREKEALKITAEQEQKLRALRADFERELARREAEVRVAEVNVREFLAAETPDLAKVEPEVKRIAALRGETRFRRIQTIQNGLAVLTQEQRQHLARHERHVAGGMMGGGMGQPGMQGMPGMRGGMGMGRGMMAPGGMMGHGMMGHGSQSGAQPGAGAAPAAPARPPQGLPRGRPASTGIKPGRIHVQAV